MFLELGISMTSASRRYRTGLAAVAARITRHGRSPGDLPSLVWKNLCYPFTAGAAERRRDRRMGIDTAGILAKGELDPIGEAASLGIDYVPTPSLIAEYLIRRVADRARQFTFVDFGAGKGRVAVLAAKYPFARVIGIEHSPRLVAAAKDNAVRFAQRNKSAAPVDIVLADATEWPLPPGPSVLFFYYPFESPMMEKVAAHIVASQQHAPRKLFLVFYNEKPYERVFRQFFAHPGFRREEVSDLPHDRTAPFRDHRAVIFESLP
ncbi:MAG TPA: class I SAM-dependent methyltransferase [Acetobacteraceae bacterium]|nr:class I SAM-dependent methyltransferase [Acetobacteraceae bacterium]